MDYGRSDYNTTGGIAGDIEPDEPVFVIRGKDAVGWAAVYAWASLAEIAGVPALTVESARQHAVKMKKYAKEHGKLPDAP